MSHFEKRTCMFLTTEFFKPVYRQPTKCKNDVDLLFAIKSVPKNGDRRDSLRNSWLDSSFYNGLKIKHVFLFGNKGNHVEI